MERGELYSVTAKRLTRDPKKQVPIGVEVGRRHPSLPKTMLTRCPGRPPARRLEDLDRALAAALDLNIAALLSTPARIR